jgi:hypothetical protein
MSYYPNSYQQTLSQPHRASMWPTPVFPQADIPTLIQDPMTGEVFLNPRKTTQKWCYLSSNPYPVTLSSTGATLPVSLTPPLEDGNSGDVEIVKLMAKAAVSGSGVEGANRFGVVLEDTVTQRKFMNNPICSNLVFGNAQFPFTLYETIFLPATSNLIAYCTNYESSSNAIRIVAEGRRFVGCGPRQQLQQAFYQRRSHPYWLTFDNLGTSSGANGGVTVAANSTTTYTMTVPSSGDFNCWLIMDESTTDYHVRILETTSGRSLMLGPGENGQGRISCKDMVASTRYGVTGFPNNLLTAANTPHAWTFTHTFKRGTQISFELTNTTGSQIVVRLALHGQLVYYQDCPNMIDPDRARILQNAMVPMPAPANWLPCAAPGCTPAPEPIPGILPSGVAPATNPINSPYYVPPPAAAPQNNAPPTQQGPVLNPWASPGWYSGGAKPGF